MQKNNFIISKLEMETRLAAWQQARSSYLKTLTESPKLNTELENFSQATYDIYVKALNSLSKDVERNFQLAQQNEVKEIEKLKHMIDDASETIIEINDFLDIDLTEIKAIDTLVSDVIEFASKSNQAYDAIKYGGQPDYSPAAFEAGDSPMSAM